ncbi:clathrin heavy chain linker domain-containing protein 1 [Gymnogyps californianus]|uniref:clathrin heavy chain linker domain-containing protein 1 n=1 Tax=Gymnogyps californianus TaxID=33616 RepID=UPI0021CA583C|nr:clathrin heavy chain linker domain-containing protein 1 [Gymnogyps californianus]
MAAPRKSAAPARTGFPPAPEEGRAARRDYGSRRAPPPPAALGPAGSRSPARGASWEPSALQREVSEIGVLVSVQLCGGCLKTCYSRLATCGSPKINAKFIWVCRENIFRIRKALGDYKLCNLSPQLYYTIGKEQWSLKTSLSVEESLSLDSLSKHLAQLLMSLVKRLKIHLSILKVSVNYFPNSAITLEAIKCALSEKQLNLVTHWVTQQRLTFSEAVGDSIYDSEKVESSNESKCLALAQVTYGQSGTHKKVALCLCIQSRISGAMDYIQQLEHFFSDDYFFLLQNCPSTALIRCFSQQWLRKPPFSSVGTTILSFISANHKKHGFELLEEMSKKNALEQVILNDTVCTLEDWNKIAVACAENKHEKLSQKIVSILTSQDGVFENSPLEDEKDAKIMEHVFWSSVPLCISFHYAESSKGRRISSGSLWRAGRLSTDLLSFNQVQLHRLHTQAKQRRQRRVPKEQDESS